MQLFPRSRSEVDETAADAGTPGSADRHPIGAATTATTTVPAVPETRRRQLSLRPPVGLHLSSDALRACQVRRTGEPLTGSVALPTGAIVDGEIRDPQRVAEALRQLWSEGGFNSRRVVVGVSNQDVVTRQLDVPPMNDRDTRDALGFELQSAIPFPPGESELDFQRIETVSGPTQPTCDRILAIAALRSMSRTVLTTLTAARLRVDAIDLVPLALVRAITDDVDEQTHAIVHLGSDSLTIAVHNHHRVRFARTVMTPSVASSLSGEIESQLSEFSELWDTTAGGGDQRRSTSENPSARAIEGTLEYYESQEGATPIERLTIVGDLQIGSTLAPALHQELRIPISLASPLHAEPITDSNAAAAAMPTAEYVAAYGLSLDPANGGPARPRLLPPPENPDDPRDLAKRAVAAVAVAGLVAFGCTAAFSPDSTQAESELAVAEIRYEDTIEQLDALEADFDAAMEREELSDVVADATEYEVRWSALIRSIEDAAPAGASLLAVRSDLGGDPDADTEDDAALAEDDAAAPAIGTLEITGQSVGQSTIGAWMSALETVPGIRDPWLSNAATTEDVDNTQFTNFSITMTIDETATIAAGRTDAQETP